MKLFINNLTKILVTLLIIVFTGLNVKAQTPTDDPGIGGPGVGAAPAGDGSPIVPLDGGMSIMLIASGIGFGAKRLRKNC